MDIYNEILSLNGEGLLKYWLELCDDCRATQEEVLKSIIENSRDTEYGKAHNFSSIKSVEDYRRNVDISDYDAFEDYIERMANGERDLLFPGLTDFFISTSGTTGKSKKIPESKEGLEAKSAVLTLRNGFLAKTLMENIMDSKKFKELIVNKNIDVNNLSRDLINNVHFYSVTSASPNKKTSGGIDIGFASGKTFENSKFASRLSYPKELMGLSDGEATMYLTMMFALRYDDVVFITSNNAGRFYSRIKYAQEHAEEMINDLRCGTISERLNISDDERKLFESYIEPHPQRADELEELLNRGRKYFIPKYYWKYLFVGRFWLSGSVGVNVDKVRKYLGDVLYFDIGYGASEGKLNIPFKNDIGYGTLAIASVFFEFIPVGEDTVLTADELEDGGEYEIILTTYSGLYRYPLHDIVKVRGFVGNTPNIEFISKSKEILNIAQEKVPAPGVLDCLNRFIESKGFNLRQAQIYPNNKEISYEIYIELENVNEFNQKDIDLDSLNIEFDDLLRNKFELYNRNRKFESLEPLRIYVMREGWQKHLYDLKEKTGAPRSQVKLATMINEAPENEWIII